MIDLYLTGQKLAVHTPLIVAGSVDYLTIQIHRDDEEWEGLSLHIFLQQEPITYELLTDGDFIGTDKHLNLTAGEWSVSVVGYDYEDGEMVEKITTNTIGLTVAPAPPDAGESLPETPATAYEQIEAIALSVRADADAGLFNGEKGEKGDKGETAMTARVGSVTTGAPGTYASVVNSGDDKDLVFDFTIPRGDIGPQGEKGPKGDTGAQGPQGEKGDKGDTGNVSSAGDMTVYGVLDITNRRCYANLSQAGWYRVCKSADISGTIIDFSICRPYGSSPAEAHRISFYVVGGGKSAFLDETSDSNTLLVDKIRCINGGGLMYFDIHYTASSSNQVLVYFDVSGKGQENQSTVAESLQSVADSPSGETVLTEYTFATNRRALLTTNIFRIRRTYSNITISSNNGYILLDSFENMGVSSQNYCLGFNIVGWSGFPTYGFQIMRGSNGTDFYLASSNAGTFGSFTVEYWFADLSA